MGSRLRRKSRLEIQANTEFYQRLKAGPDRVKASNDINNALKNGNIEQARQLADQYNQEYVSNFKDWANKYADFSNATLVKDYRAGKINLTSSDIRTRLKALK